MNVHKYARLTPNGREAIDRAIELWTSGCHSGLMRWLDHRALSWNRFQRCQRGAKMI